jgi:N6-L-threonylcarbamoyladenine synthase
LESIKYCHRNIIYPHLHLLISGGNTQLILSSGPGRYTILGQSIDDAIGEAIDKIARNLSSDWSSSGGLGKSLEKLAETGKILPYRISCLDHFNNPLTFSFSGYKTSLIEFIKNNFIQESENLAATVQAVLFDHLLDRTEMCFKILTNAKLNIKQMSVIGGVACNQYFRSKLSEKLQYMGVELIVPQPEICTDNAVMIGLAAMSVLNHSNSLTKFKHLMNRPDQDWNIEELSISKSVVE